MVEGGQDVETAEGDVSLTEARQRLRRGQHGAEATRRGRRAVGDHGKRRHLQAWCGPNLGIATEAARPSPDRCDLVTMVNTPRSQLLDRTTAVPARILYGRCRTTVS